MLFSFYRSFGFISFNPLTYLTGKTLYNFFFINNDRSCCIEGGSYVNREHIRALNLDSLFAHHIYCPLSYVLLDTCSWKITLFTYFIRMTGCKVSVLAFGLNTLHFILLHRYVLLWPPG